MNEYAKFEANEKNVGEIMYLLTLSNTCAMKKVLKVKNNIPSTCNKTCIQHNNKKSFNVKF